MGGGGGVGFESTSWKNRRVYVLNLIQSFSVIFLFVDFCSSLSFVHLDVIRLCSNSVIHWLCFIEVSSYMC